MTDRTDNSNHALAGRSSADDRDTVEVVRSEEQLRVGTAVRVSGRAVLRRYVVTETVTQTFQVRREEVRLDHEPVRDGERIEAGGAAFDDRVVEVVLRREVPSVQLKVVATERVRLHVDTVTRQVQVSDQLDREEIDVDLPSTRPTPI